MNLQEFKRTIYMKTASPVYKKTLMECDKVASSNVNVLILGEPGTGKETLARYIHLSSMRSEEPFVSVNCMAFQPDDLRDELFGHTFNTLHDGGSSKPGRLETANRGTLFLQDSLAIDLTTQFKLLDALESKTFTPLGSVTPKRIDCRIISSTSNDFSQKVIGSNVNEGYYYRISTICLRIPPLRERKEDLVDLIQFFLDKAQRENNIRIDTIEDNAWQFLTNYEYPGNLWELENTLERMVVLSSNNAITGEGIPILYNIRKDSRISTDMLEIPDRLLTWKEFKQLSEKKFLENALLQMNWNISATAKQLSMSARQIFNKMKEYEIEKPPI